MDSNRTTVAQQYGSRTLVGNWFEESVLKDYKIKEFLQKKEQQKLELTRNASSTQNSQSAIAISKSRDGFLRYGNSMLILSTCTQGLLSVNQDLSTFTSSLARDGPAAENIFIVEPAGTPRRPEVCFGDTFYLRLHPSLSSEPLYLISEPINLTTSLKNKMQQLKVSNVKSSDALWTSELKDISARFEAHKQPILSDCEIIIKHVSTGNLLFADNNAGPTEYPVYVHTASSGAKKHGLLLEQQGTLLPDVPMHPEPLQNAWAFLLGSSN